MRIPLFDRGNLQCVGVITVPDHRMPRGLVRIETLAFDVKVNEHIELEPKLDLVRITFAVVEGMQLNGWAACATSEKSMAMMRLAYSDHVDGLDEVPVQHRPAAREALRAVFQFKEAT